MENNTKNETDIEARKAKLMAVRLSAYEAEGRPSYFEKLDGRLQRAIEREAKFQVESLIKSDFYSKELSERDSGIINRLYRAHCEYYSKLIQDQRNLPNNKYNPRSYERILLQRDSKAIENHYISEQHDNKTTQRAHSIDTKIIKENNQEKIGSHIDAMLNLKDIRTR